jgi:hypothetical protein
MASQACSGGNWRRTACNSPGRPTQAQEPKQAILHGARQSRKPAGPSADDAGQFNVLIQAVMARSEVKPTSVNPNANDPAPGTMLMTVDVSGDPVTQNGQPVSTPMPFPMEGKAPNQPKFLADITERNGQAGSSSSTRRPRKAASSTRSTPSLGSGWSRC